MVPCCSDQLAGFFSLFGIWSAPNTLYKSLFPIRCLESLIRRPTLNRNVVHVSICKQV